MGPVSRSGLLRRLASQHGTSSVPILPDTAQVSSEATVRFLVARVKSDPDDMIAENMLASQMLLRLRETGNADDLERALRAARVSLASVPSIRNLGGLSALVRAEIAGHDFVSARSHALELTRVDPSTVGSYALLADALLELGDYGGADMALKRMGEFGRDNAETEIRLGRILFLRGDTDNAERRFFRALAFARNVVPPPRESIAWCQWQLGEMRFSKGDYPAADCYYRDALATYPNYVQAMASLGRVLAARGYLAGAISQYEHAARRYPDPTFLAALGDLYNLAGRTHDGENEYAFIEQIRHLSKVNGVRYNRQIALIDADHNRNAQAAYLDAAAEYRERRDIYGADAVAWTALKAGKLPEAKRAIQSALRLSTQDARLLYHAGMIAQAAGDPAAARAYLKRALALNPHFDPLQAALARSSITTFPRTHN